MKVQVLETFECSGQISSNFCHFWNNRSVFLQILHRSSGSWDITPLYSLAQNLYLKEPIESSRKSEILHLDGLLLSKSCTVSAKKVQKSYLSWHWTVIQSFFWMWWNPNSLFLKNDMRNLMDFNLSSEKSENLDFDGMFLSKVCNVWAKIK